jgi:aminoglycoside phosphotransferase (APT) family kinase protein
MDREIVEKRLIAALEKRLKKPFSVEQLELLTGGSAAQTWRFVLVEDSDSTEYILRLAHSGDQFELGIDKKAEAIVQSHAVEHGVLAPKIILAIEPEDQLGEGFIMELIHGETIPQKILRQDEYGAARAQMAAQCGRLLADIHKVPIDALDFLPDMSAKPQLSLLKSFYKRFGEVVPIFDYTFHWLERNIPLCKAKTLVHADFRNGNLIVDETGIVSILDWELAHLGDPMEDLGWLCVNSWRFGHSDKPVGGFGSREDLYTSYEGASGTKVDETSVHFWELLGVLKWGIICLYQTGIHLSGEERSVNRAAIGRRVSETELDLLVLLSKA